MPPLLCDRTLADAHAALAMCDLRVTREGMTLKILVRLVVLFGVRTAHSADAHAAAPGGARPTHHSEVPGSLHGMGGRAAAARRGGGAAAAQSDRAWWRRRDRRCGAGSFGHAGRAGGAWCCAAVVRHRGRAGRGERCALAGHVSFPGGNSAGQPRCCRKCSRRHCRRGRRHGVCSYAERERRARCHSSKAFHSLSWAFEHQLTSAGHAARRLAVTSGVTPLVSAGSAPRCTASQRLAATARPRGAPSPRPRRRTRKAHRDIMATEAAEALAQHLAPGTPWWRNVSAEEAATSELAEGWSAGALDTARRSAARGFTRE